MKCNCRRANIAPRKRLLFAAIFALVSLLLYAPPSGATHRVEHRFTVFGRVLEGTSFPGKPLPRRRVSVMAAETGETLSTSLTDEEGRYSILLHVHNEGLGMRIVIVSGRAREELELKFDPSDNETERKERVDLIVFPKGGN